MKSKINYWKLVKSSRNLVTNINFRNNQNYIISDYSKFKFYRTYYRTWFSKNIWKILWNSFIIITIIWIFSKILKEDFLINFWIEYLFIWWFIFFLLSLLFIVFDSFFYFFYKKFSFMFWKKKFISNRFIFLKRPKKSWFSFNRRDFISFKK